MSLKLALATAILLLLIGLPLAYWLAFTRSRWRPAFEAFVNLPFVLPPTVLGFYLLLLLAPSGWIGRLTEASFGTTFVFSFPGLLLGSLIFNLPIAVQPFATAMGAIERRLIETAWCLGSTKLKTFFKVIVPLAWPGIVVGVAMAFAHTIGEFGVAMMIGGNIAGQTRTASIAVYDSVQALDYTGAHRLAAIQLLICFTLLIAISFLKYVGPSQYLKPNFGQRRSRS